MTTRDIIPIVTELYGIPNPDGIPVQMERNWAQLNPGLADMFFNKEHLDEETKLFLGYDQSV